MTKMLKLTELQLEEFVNGKLSNRFEMIFDDIPFYHSDNIPQKGETHRSYLNKHNSEYRWFIFKDKETDIEYCINYTYNHEYPNDVTDKSELIEYVNKEEDSDIYVAPIPIVEPEKILTPEQQADKEIWDKYQALKHECRIVLPKERLKIPKKVIDEILNLLKMPHFSIFQLRSLVIPVCIEYKIEDVSFWHWIQVKRKVWK